MSIHIPLFLPPPFLTKYRTRYHRGVLDWIVEPFLPESACIQFQTTRPIGSSLDCNDISTLQCADFDFVATLTNLTNPTTVTGGTHDIHPDIHCCKRTKWDSGAVQRNNCRGVSNNKPNSQCCRYIQVTACFKCSLVTVSATADL